MLGMLALTRFTRDGAHVGYSDDDLLLALALADHAALAILKARARAEADEAIDELARTNAAHQLLFDANPAPMYVIDEETLGWLAVNDAALALFGYTREEFLAMPVENIRPPAERAGIAARIADARGKDTSTRVVLLKKGGGRMTVDATSRPLPFRGRRGRLVVVQDVTAQIKLEEQLRQSQKMEAIGVLAGGVAHDFNNLLSVIIGFASLALDTLPPDAPQRADIEEIKGAGERAAALTRQLLAFSRKQVLQPRDVDVNGVIRQLMAMLKRLVPANIAVTFAPSPALGVVRVDPSQLEQVLLNLVVNAKDAISGSGRIAISTNVADLDEQYAAAHLDIVPGRYAVIEVADDGCGMDKTTQAQIFEPFFTTKPVGQGSGLGLSTVFGIVKQSGGTIWVYSEPGQGTTFKVFLPLAAASEDTGKAATPAPAGGSETVLLVEDEAQVRRLVEAVLVRAGYRVLTAADGAEALRVAEAHAGEIAVLLTDVVMPGMSGRELATELARKRPAMRVVYMSGYTDDPIVQQRVAEGAVFLQKPVLSATLLGAIRTALERKVS
jgi:PAS domain S-box-containing protein